MCNWWEWRTNTKGVLPPAPQNSLIKMDQVATGFLEGVMNLPVDGQWQIRFGFFTPTYIAGTDPSVVFPAESMGPPVVGDSISMNINGLTQIFNVTSTATGKRLPVVFTVEDQQLRYRFIFMSPTPVGRAHPFISPGEVVLLRDRNVLTAALAAPATLLGNLAASAIDAADGNLLAKGAAVSNGYVAGAWSITQEATLSVFSGTTLVAQLSFSGGKINAALPAGTYSCIAVQVANA